MSSLAIVTAVRVCVETALLATLLGGAPALLLALWITEVAPRSLARPSRRVIQAAATLPTLVWGHLALLALAPSLDASRPSYTAPHVAAVGLAAAFAPSFALLATRALRATPAAVREAALALGATRAQTTVRAVIPSALGALTAGVVRALARVLVEGAALVWLLSRVELTAPSPSANEGLLRALAPWASRLRAVTGDAHSTGTAVVTLAAILCVALASSSLARRLNVTR